MTEESTLIIRPSTVGSYMLCGARPGQRGYDGYNYAPNEMLLFGSAVHWVIEQELLLKGFSKKGIIEEMFIIFEKDQPIDPTPLSKVTTKAQREAVADGVIQAVEEWAKYVLPSLPASEAHIEEKLSASAGFHGDTGVIVSGTPDIFWPDDSLMIDWKTAGRQWDDKKKEGQLQPTAYRWMARENGYNIQHFWFWVYDRSSNVWKKHETDLMKKGQVEAFKEQAITSAVSIDRELWGYNPAGQGWAARGWHCSPKYCDAWKICKGKYLIADGKASEPALTTKERWS